MERYRLGHLVVTLGVQAAREYLKVSYPVRYGSLSEIVSNGFTFYFNLNGEPKYVQGRPPQWPHPAEWVKRTAGNDWIYYWSGEYAELFDLFGEYYLPCLPYPSNSIFPAGPLEKEGVAQAAGAYNALSEALSGLEAHRCPGRLRDFLDKVAACTPSALSAKAERLHALLGGPLSVLPPECRHVDYDVLPVMVTRGCLYHCAFCRVQSQEQFSTVPHTALLDQIEELRRLYADDLPNYKAVFLGCHDALAAGEELIEFAARHAFAAFDLEGSLLRGMPLLFLFGSAHSLLGSPQTLFETLDRLPYYTYINIGLESPDTETLRILGKPLEGPEVEKAFEKMLWVNERYRRVEVSANFVLGGALPPAHLCRLGDFVRDKLARFSDKGAIYLSPLVDTSRLSAQVRRAFVRDFQRIKLRSRLPAYLYLIQRL